MHLSGSTLISLLCSVGIALAQLPPSPTASVGCEPHDDHWYVPSFLPYLTILLSCLQNNRHCDGPASGVASKTSSSLPPSPTASTGCEPHGDHWHCDAPASSGAPQTGAVTSSKASGASSAAVLPPSPTASTGCEPHGDHWHCDGPASATSAASSAASSSAAAASSEAASSAAAAASSGAAIKVSGAGPVVGAFGMAVLALL